MAKAAGGRMTFPIAHRGSSIRFRENSYEAFEAAVKEAAVLELDIRKTSDGVPVCAHDWSLERVYGDDRGIDQVTWKELQQLAPDLPSLEKVLNNFGTDVGWFLDHKLDDKAIDEQVEIITRECGMRPARRDELSSGEPLPPGTFVFETPQMEVAQRLKKITGACCCVLIPGKFPRDFLHSRAASIATWADAVVLPDRLASDETIEVLHAVDLPVFVYTVNDRDRYSELVMIAADGVFTDDVPALIG